MKKTNQYLPSSWLALLGLLISYVSCSSGVDGTDVVPAANSLQAEQFDEVIWHIKAIHPEGRMIDIKALDGTGNIYDVKAIQATKERQLLDIKALVGNERLPVKILVSEDTYAPVKAIGKDGTIYDIKALTDSGEKLDVKGISCEGNIIHIKAIAGNGEFYGVKAISPKGELNDVKGIKTSDDNLELTVHGVAVHAHIKAIPQDGCVGDHSIWHVKAIHPQGRTLDVKAIDKSGNLFDIKAIQDANQRQFMDVKSLMGDSRVPVKILSADDQFAPVKAIGEDGTIYDIKAITSDGVKLDVKGVRRSGNLIDIKAINQEGDFYAIKAISPAGQLNDIKGVKMSEEDLEVVIHGVNVHAHVKAIPQIN